MNKLGYDDDNGDNDDDDDDNDNDDDDDERYQKVPKETQNTKMFYKSAKQNPKDQNSTRKDQNVWQKNQKGPKRTKRIQINSTYCRSTKSTKFSQK